MKQINARISQYISQYIFQNPSMKYGYSPEWGSYFQKAKLYFEIYFWM